jgi:hypothetical protein
MDDGEFQLGDGEIEFGSDDQSASGMRAIPCQAVLLTAHAGLVLLQVRRVRTIHLTRQMRLIAQWAR